MLETLAFYFSPPVSRASRCCSAAPARPDRKGGKLKLGIPGIMYVGGIAASSGFLYEQSAGPRCVEQFPRRPHPAAQLPAGSLSRADLLLPDR